MDMYQKREQRKKNKIENNNKTEGFPKVSINWDIGTYRQIALNPYKIKFFAK